jgi:hypothetical protein
MVAKQGPLLISITDYNKQETYLRAPQCHSNHRQHLGRLDTGTAIEAPHGSRAITVMGWEWDHYFPQHTAEQSTSSKTQAGLERTTLMVPVPHCLHINAGKKSLNHSHFFLTRTITNTVQSMTLKKDVSD